MTKQLDMQGQPCPMPVVGAKKLLAEADTAAVEVLVDNLAAVQNLEKMARGMGHGYSYTKQHSKLYTVLLTKGTGAPTPQAVPAADNAPAPATSAAPTVLITSDAMGTGSEELGKILMKGFIFSLTELDPAPAAVIFLNGGARLTTEGAATVADLQALAAKGAEVLTCGTCANYYGLTEKLAVGKITDMMGITARLASAARLICL